MRKKFCLQFGHALPKTFLSPLVGRRSLKNMGLKGCQIMCLLRAPTDLGPTLASLSCQNEQENRAAEGHKCFSPETSVSLLKSFSITFSASFNIRRIYFSLFFLQEQVFADVQGAPFPSWPRSSGRKPRRRFVIGHVSGGIAVAEGINTKYRSDNNLYKA